MTESTKSTPRKSRGQPKKAAESVRIQHRKAPTRQTGTKIGTVTGLLREEGGASLEELVAATGWQPHTTRAALTGLRKKGHTIAKDKVDGVARYSIAMTESEARTANVGGA